MTTIEKAFTQKATKKTKNDGWAEYHPGPKIIYGSLWGVPFYADKPYNDPDICNDEFTEDDPEIIKCLVDIDHCNSWPEYFKQAKHLCKIALKKKVEA